MKFLVDANLSWRLVKHLEGDFSGSVHLNRSGLQQNASDTEIYLWAKNNHFTILSCDDDFHHLSLQYGFPPKIIIVKTGNISTLGVGNMIRDHKAEILAFLTNNEVGVLELV